MVIGIKKSAAVAVVVGAVLLSATGARAACEQYVGKKLSPSSYDDVMAVVSKIPSLKDEFETTDTFNKRVADSKVGLPETFIIGYALHDKKYLKYDADNGYFNVKTYTFNNVSKPSYDYVFWENPHEIEYGSSRDNVDLPVSKNEQITDSYEGSNAFGATVKVIKIKRMTNLIFDKKGSRKRSYGDYLFRDLTNKVGVNTIPMSITQAKAFKAEVRAAVLIKPKPPYFAQGRKRHRPEVDFPQDIDEHINVIIADIQCVFLMDGDNKVLASYATY